MDNDEKYIVFYKKSDYKDRNHYSDRDFFDKYDTIQNKYWTPNDDGSCLVLMNLRKDDTLSKPELVFGFRYAACIQQAYSLGRCLVKWQNLLALSSRKCFETLKSYYDTYIKEDMKDIVNAWDEKLKENSREQ